MPIKPGKDETQTAFMNRCVPEMIGTGDNKRPQDQAVAACSSIWEDSTKSLRCKRCDPSDYDDDERDQFMSDCQDEGSDEDECAQMWEERSIKAIRHKTHAGPVNGMEFCLSDETPDRMDDIILSDGWDLKNFQNNPIALFNHRSDFP